jgi:NagD protein
MGLTYDRLCRAAYWINEGKPFIATHPDLVCPTDLATVLVDCGSICAALEKATGRKPMAIPGKPDRLMLDGLIGRHRIGASQLAVVGDRLYTDMAMARASGALGVLVLTGETTADQAAHSPLPDLVVKDLHELGRLLSQAKRTL